MVRRSELIVSIEMTGNHWLTNEVYDKDDWPSFTAKLAQLGINEIGLNGGRFQNFSFVPQTYEVLWNPKYYRGSADVQYYLEEKFHWIATRTSYKWSFDIHFKNVSSCEIKWSFENKVDAIRFVLDS